MTLTRRAALLGALATPSLARAAPVPSWPECGRKPRCDFVRVSRSQDLTTCQRPPRDSRGEVLTRGGPCWMPTRTNWQCKICGKLEATVE